MQFGDGGGTRQIIGQSGEEAFARRGGRDVGHGPRPASQRLLGLLQTLHREVDRLAILGHQHGQPQHGTRPGPPAEPLRVQEVVNGDEIAVRL